MDRKLYKRECLLRSPKFRHDLERLHRDHPRLWNPPDLWTDEAKRPAEADWEACRAFQATHSFLTMEEVSMVLQPAPLLFDPAWKVCVDSAVFGSASVIRCQANGTKEILQPAPPPTLQGGLPPPGLVTRAGVEPVGKPGPAGEQIYEKARTEFENLPEETRALLRRSYAPKVFQAALILLPIGPETTLKQVRRIWPHVERSQEACYGDRARKKTPRAGIYEDRLWAYDEIRIRGRTANVAAKLRGKKPKTVLRRLKEALRDIEGFTGELTPEGYRDHVSSCPRCRKAEAREKTDLYCSWMQRQLGPRDSSRKYLPAREQHTEPDANEENSG